MKILAVTCLFNPCGYKRLVENYERFRAHMQFFKRDGVTTVASELALDGDRFETTAEFQFIGTRDLNLMWQKEALLNATIRSMGPLDKWDAICWFDADALLMSSHWPRELLKTLNEKIQVAQLFSKAHMVDSYGACRQAYDSCGYAMSVCRGNWHDFAKHHPGLAWAATPRALINGLYDLMPSGNSDTLMACIFGGIAPSHARVNLTPSHLANLAEWGSTAPGGGIGFVLGSAVHLYHGNNQNRQRALQRTLNVGLEPGRHFRRSGVLIEWTDFAPQSSKSLIAEHFASRKEDS